MGILNTPNNTNANNTLGGGVPQEQSPMSINLVKGQKLDLTKGNPGLDKLKVGLGWDASGVSGVEFDLDAEVFMLGANGKMVSNNHIVFYNNPTSSDGAIKHMGDNRTGAGAGDDETVSLQLSQISPEVDKLVFTVTIYDAVSRKQNFGQVNNAYIRIINEATGQEMCRFDLSEDYSTSISMIMGKVYRHNGEWKFEASGTGSTSDLSGLCRDFGC